MGTGHSARILIGARPQVKDTLLHILQAEFALDFCHTVSDAIRLLEHGSYDAILCTLQFDSSRMFELLRQVKTNPSTASIPFVALKIGGGILSDESIAHVLKAARLLGADECVDLPQWRRQSGDEPAYAQLRALVHRLCSP